jgi:hypothetical protein
VSLGCKVETTACREIQVTVECAECKRRLGRGTQHLFQCPQPIFGAAGLHYHEARRVDAKLAQTIAKRSTEVTQGTVACDEEGVAMPLGQSGRHDREGKAEGTRAVGMTPGEYLVQRSAREAGVGQMRFDLGNTNRKRRALTSAISPFDFGDPVAKTIHGAGSV